MSERNVPSGSFDLKLLAQRTWEAFDEVWAVLVAEGVAAGGSLLGREPRPDDVEPLTWALYEKGRTLDALSYRRSLTEIRRAARQVAGTALASGARFAAATMLGFVAARL